MLNLFSNFYMYVIINS